MDTGGQRAWADKVWAQVVAHVEAEEDIAGDYRTAAAQADSPDLRYLIELISEDEARHHRVLTELANSLRSANEWRSIDPSLPEGAGRPVSPDLMAATKRFIEVEKQDARNLEELRRELRPVAATTIWSLLVELMELDTKKHLRILEFIAGRRAR